MTTTEPAFELTFPAAEAEFVKAHYRDASVILEYGSGGSTLLAASQEKKTVFSVESDQAWAANIAKEVEKTCDPTSKAVIHPVDIGRTKRWGRPDNDKNWRRYWQYPLSVWQREDFQQPDLILVDGVFRPACVIAAMLMTEKPVTILFDDYLNPRADFKEVKPRFQALDEIIKPVEFCGRIARFEISQDNLERAAIPKGIAQFFRYF